ncbi:hypothetical protein NAP1_14693 [Erythrobacter sp. NAP1]|uniref:hypothetical protein n=1 Tax=Erythrobacter sp. NAP1 TaxID=237727 RepID=UPI000068787B|nr:hypothetical protein [Erythrobacter sp. NAP1]EAQ28856.1 hypothetical protein NAP1_14693 [Erythrobacter sp. NAP1]
MSAAFKDNVKLAAAAILIAAGGFWFNMERYQKDRVATVIVRSVENVVSESSEPERLETTETRQDRNPAVSDY